MMHFATWLSPSVMRLLGWSLLNFVWEGLALAGVLATLLALTRRAQTRYAIAVATLVLMLAAPVVTFGVLSRSGAGEPPADATSLPNLAMSLRTFAQITAPAGAGPVSKNSAPSGDLMLWFVEAWFAGVVLLSLRTAGGLFLVGRLRRKEAQPVTEALRRTCLTLQKRLGIRRAIQFCESCRLDAPAVIGWFRPVVLLPVAALAGLSTEQLEAVIAHELAHIRRLDCFVNLFQMVTETFLFYHPAVWWVSKRIRAERENCCDDVAISVGGDALEYARALAQMAESHAAPSFAMAANRGPLAARVARLLGMSASGPGIRSAGFAASILCLAGALFAGNAFVGMAQNFFEWNRVPAAALAASHASPTASAAQVSPEPQSQAAAEPHSGERNAGASSGGSYIEGMKEAGLDNLTMEQLISLKVQGVTPDYVKQIHALGLQPTVDEIISMKVQGITPEYIRDMRAAGVDAKIDRLIGMKVQGITPGYVSQMKAIGFNPGADDIIGMKVQGIDPAYAVQMKALGLHVSADKLIAMKVQGITPEYVKDMQAAGVDVNIDKLISMKVQGINHEYAVQMKVLGFRPNADELIGMKVQGVSPEYAKAMEAAGLGKLTADEIIRAKVQGVTPKFVQQVRSHGFKDLTLDKVIELKRAGIF